MDELIEWLREAIDAQDSADRDQAAVDLREAHSALLAEYAAALATAEFWEKYGTTPRLAGEPQAQALLHNARGYLLGLERAVRCAGQAYRRLPGYRPEWDAGSSPLMEQRETPC